MNSTECAVVWHIVKCGCIPLVCCAAITITTTTTNVANAAAIIDATPLHFRSSGKHVAPYFRFYVYYPIVTIWRDVCAHSLTCLKTWNINICCSRLHELSIQYGKVQKNAFAKQYSYGNGMPCHAMPCHGWQKLIDNSAWTNTSQILPTKRVRKQQKREKKTQIHPHAYFAFWEKLVYNFSFN